MREIKTHQATNSCNNLLRIEVDDTVQSKGGASKTYHTFIRQNNEWNKLAKIVFQDGGKIEDTDGKVNFNLNGLTNEALLAILIDRLQCFQKGKFPCRENALVLTKLEEAMHWLNHRTNDRTQRGVEGFYKE